jgi:hypothetical protein
MLMFTEGGKPKKNPRGKGENNTSNKLNSHMVPELRIEPTTFGTTAVRGERFTATPPMPQIITNVYVVQYLNTVSANYNKLCQKHTVARAL